MQLLRRLTRCHQDEKTVTEYTHELNELFNMIGTYQSEIESLSFGMALILLYRRDFGETT